MCIRDRPKEHSAEAVKMLKNHGVKVVMLTGDNKSAAAAAAEKLGITAVSYTHLDVYKRQGLNTGL